MSFFDDRQTMRLSALAVLTLLIAAPAASADPRSQAKRMHDRLVGVPPSAELLGFMEASIAAGDSLGAAYLAMEDSAFYTSALKNFTTPWTNESQTVFGDLNDYSATVIGIVRDDLPFTDILSADIVYVGAPGVVESEYSHTDNDHYRELDEARADLGDPDLLVPVAQSELPGSQLQSADAAGVITTRAAGEAFFKAGTNRRMWRFTAMNFLCRDMEQLHDITRSADRIRQDVSRSPGGDSSIFHNTCVGCHSGMDPMAQAFSYFNFDEEQERVVHTPGQVQAKYLINSGTFPFGFVTENNRWDNFWRSGPNSSLGWDGGDGGGFGPKSLGQEVASSRAFSQCQVEKVFKRVCLRPPSSAGDRAEVGRITDVFEAQAYSLKRVFAETARFCMGE